MPDKRLYAVPFSRDSQSSQKAQQRQRLAKQSVLQSDIGNVESIASEPNKQLITGWARAKYGNLIANMAEELFRADDLTIPVFAPDETNQIDGYYTTENVSVKPADPRYEDWNRIDGVIARKGSRKSHFRAVSAGVTSADSPFGSDSTLDLAISYRARDVQWYDKQTNSTESATVQSTVEGEHDQFDIYDASEPTFDDPYLTYDLPYRHEAPSDCRVWDDYGRAKEDVIVQSSPTVSTSTAVGTGTTVGSERTVASTWQRVFVTDHEWRGLPVVESDRLRLVPDVERGVLFAYRWNASDEHWDILQLGDSSWHLLRWNIQHIGFARIEARAVFTDGSSEHRVDIGVRRGLEDALVVNAPDEGSMPSGLQTRLSPIATDAADDAGERATIVKRIEVE